MRTISVLSLCIVSAAVGAGIDHYWNDLSSLAGLDWGKPTSSPRPKASEAKPNTANSSAAGKNEILGGSGQVRRAVSRIEIARKRIPSVL